MSKILIIEDNKGISSYLNLELKHEGFEIFIAETGRAGLELFESENPDLILLDLMLPELNGIEVLRRIRAKSKVPVIIETARGDTIDKINGLNTGADDYISKPFEIEELIARVNALLRRSNFSKNEIPNLRYKNLELNQQSMTVKFDDKEIFLSKTEYFMLKLFMENIGKALSRNEILDTIWGKNHFIDENSVDVYIGHIRSKLKEFSNEEFIKTVRGIGFLMS